MLDRLFQLEPHYMVKEGYWREKSMVRDKILGFMNKMNLTLQLSSIRYHAVTIFDRFASRQPVTEVEDDDLQIMAITCLILAAKMKYQDVFIYDIVQGELLVRAQRHLYDIECRILRTLDWKLRILMPMDFFGYFCSLLYERGENPKPEEVEELLDRTQRDICFTQYRPSTLLVAAFLTLRPVDSFGQHLAVCKHIDMDSLHRCIDDCRRIYMKVQDICIH